MSGLDQVVGKLHVIAKPVQTIKISLMHLHLSLNEIFKCEFHLWWHPKPLKCSNYTCDWDQKRNLFQFRKPYWVQIYRVENTTISLWLMICVFKTAKGAEEKKVSAEDSYVWGENEVTVNPLSVAACLNVSIFHRRHFGLNLSSLRSESVSRASTFRNEVSLLISHFQLSPRHIFVPETKFCYTQNIFHRPTFKSLRPSPHFKNYFWQLRCCCL